MTQNAKVLSVRDDGKAEISVKRISSCGENCASCAAHCANRDMLVTAINKVGAKVGDSVTVESATSKILKIALVVYLLPLFLLIAAYFTCYALGVGYYGCIIIGFAAFALGVLMLPSLDHRAKKRQDIVYRITRIN